MVKEVNFDNELKMFRCSECEKDYFSKEIAESCEEGHSD